jgi:hypothetical protein
MVVDVDTSKESKTPNHTEYFVDQTSVPKTSKELPTLETEAVIDADISEERKSAN